MWRCPRCETFNDDQRITCEVCSEPNPMRAKNKIIEEATETITSAEPRENIVSECINQQDNCKRRDDPKKNASHPFILILCLVLFSAGVLLLIWSSRSFITKDATTQSEGSTRTKNSTESYYTYEEKGNAGKRYIAITGYKGPVDANLDIPEQIAGLPVTEIAANAFAGRGDLTGSLTIPESITSIGDHAFEDCNGLTGNLMISKGVQIIGKYAFSGCSGLTGDLIIPESVRVIDSWAFSGCKNLRSVVIPDGITKIGIRTFDFCLEMETLRIPGSVTCIEKYAFYECRNTTFEVVKDSYADEYLKKNSYQVKYYTPDHERVNILAQTSQSPESDFEIEIDSDGLVVIRSYTGSDSYVKIPAAFDGKTVSRIGKKAFSDNEMLFGVALPEGVVEIDEQAFSGCINLQNINIPNSVTTIRKYAFFKCESLQEINLPASITEIEEYVFYGCRALYEVYVPGSVKGLMPFLFYNCSNLQRVKIGYGLTYIEAGVFCGCSMLEECILPSSVLHISGDAFRIPGIANSRDPLAEPLQLYVEKGSQAELYARQNGINHQNILINHDFDGFEIQNRYRELMKVVDAGLCELDENREWVSEKGDMVSLKELPEGHIYGYYAVIQLNAKGRSSNISTGVQVEKEKVAFYLNGELWSESDLELKPRHQHKTWNYPSSGKNRVGTSEMEWYVNGACVFEKTVTIME